MTLDEAKKVAEICMTADSGCSVCVGSLTKKLNESFPEFLWAYDESAERVLVYDPEDTEKEWGFSYTPITVSERVVPSQRTAP